MSKDLINENIVTENDKLPKCGIIMPISGVQNSEYTENHWKNVKNIIERSVVKANFEPRLVCDSDSTSIIQANIVNNVYYNDIVVCDVSSKNPNVMFELGMRLAFDKPVVIIKDDKTNYTFDIGLIQHIVYPQSLAFHEIEKFINELAEKIENTYEHSKIEKSYFLKHFGRLQPQKLVQKDVDINVFFNDINDNIRNILLKMTGLNNSISDIRYNLKQSKELKKNLLQKNGDNERKFEKLEQIRDDDIPF